MSEHRAGEGEGPDVGADGKPKDENEQAADMVKAKPDDAAAEHDKREDEIIDKLGDLA